MNSVAPPLATRAGSRRSREASAPSTNRHGRQRSKRRAKRTTTSNQEPAGDRPHAPAGLHLEFHRVSPEGQRLPRGVAPRRERVARWVGERDEHVRVAVERVGGDGEVGGLVRDVDAEVPEAQRRASDGSAAAAPGRAPAQKANLRRFSGPGRHKARVTPVTRRAKRSIRGLRGPQGMPVRRALVAVIPRVGISFLGREATRTKKNPRAKACRRSG